MEIAEYEVLVNELELRVDRLRSLYDQYFMGIEKTVPSVPRKDVERRIQFLRREQVRNTGLRFRFQMILQRYGTYQTYWQRICRQIEEGTYKRHVQKAREKIAAGRAQEPKRHDSGGYDIDVEFEMEMLEMESQAPAALEELGPATPPAGDDPPTSPHLVAPPASVPLIPGTLAPDIPRGAAARPLWRKVDAAPAPAPKPAPAPAAPAPKPAAAAAPAPAPKPAPARAAAKPAAPTREGDLTDARKRELYSRYVEARRSRGESTVGITYESMSRTLRESSERLREKHGKTVDFEVTVKDGKTILKPILK